MINILITILTLLLLLLLWIMLYDSNRFVIRPYTISDPRIRKDFRAVVLSDLHNKSFGKDNERLLVAIREEHPDMILIAGDMLTAKPGMSFAPAMKLLEALAKEYPIYYGNGNHEHRLQLYPETYGDMAKRYEEALSEIGIRRMVNTHSQLTDFNVTVYSAEIDKYYYSRFHIPPMEEDYLESILGKTDPAAYNILIAHNPDYFPKYANWGADLVLAGHIHGGIIRVPFWGKGLVSPNVRFFPKYDGGLFREGDSTMLLSRGLGIHTIPFRLFNPGEVLVVDFTANKSSS